MEYNYPIQTKNLHLGLPSTQDVDGTKPKVKTRTNSELYRLFRKRAMWHSKNGFDPNNMNEPEKRPMMDIYLNGTVTKNSITQVLVEKNTFNIISNKDTGKEEGFSLTIKTIVVDVEYTLYVSKKSYKAYLERTKSALNIPQQKNLFIEVPQRSGLTQEKQYSEMLHLVKKHSNKMFASEGENLVSKRFHFKGSRFNSMANLRIVRKSFKKTETGFTAIVKTLVDEVEFRLEVFKAQHTARLVRVMQ
jgi:hypothetical protein